MDEQIVFGPSDNINDQLDWLMRKRDEWAKEMDAQLLEWQKDLTDN